MGLFDAFKKPAEHEHPFFGRLQHVRGRWRGGIELQPGARVVLFLPGPRGGPDAGALRIAERAAESWAAVRPEVEAELFAHYEAGREAAIEGIPVLSRPDEVWPHVTLSSVEIQPFRGIDTQVAMQVVWDEEHTLGAMIRDGRLDGLNGSILEPR